MSDCARASASLGDEFPAGSDAFFMRIRQFEDFVRRLNLNYGAIDIFYCGCRDFLYYNNPLYGYEPAICSDCGKVGKRCVY